MVIHAQNAVLDDEIIPLEIIQRQRSALIEAGYLRESSQAEITSLSTTSEPLLNNASYSGTNIRLQTTTTRDIDFRPNGSQFYAVGRSSLNIAEYNVSNPWNIGSSSYRRELDISPEMGSASQPDEVPHGIYIKKDDGRKMWIINRTEIWEYTLSSAWNITSATQSGYKNLDDHALRVHGIYFRPNGRVMYIDDRFVGVVFQYNLSTAWDISTATLDFALDISDQQQEVRGVELSPEGDRMFLLDTARREILEYSLSTPFDLRSASFIGSYSVSSQSSDPRGLAFKPDMRGFYITDATSNRMYQYQIAFPPDPQLSTISTSTTKVQANNQNSARITVVAKDRDGELLQGVRTDLRVGNSTIQSANTNSSGEANFDVTNSSIEQVEYSARIDGVQIQGSVSINYIGIDANRSSLTASANRVLSDGSAFSEITVTVRDEDNQPFSNLQMELIPNGGSSSIQSVQSTTNSQGIARFRVSNQTSEQVTYRARGLGTTITDRVTVTFIGVDVDRSSMSISENRIQANGQTQAEITIIVRDQENEPLSGLRIDLLPDRGSSSIETVQRTSDNQGRAIFRVSNQTPEQVTYRARGMGMTLTDRVTVDFLGIDPDLSSISVSSTRIQANGSEQAEITISARDEDNRPFTNLDMDLIPDSGSSSIQNVQRTTDSEGTAIFRVSSETPEQVIYQVRGMGITLTEEITIDFLGIDPDLSSIVISSTRIQANGTEQAEITVSARDEDNRPFTNLNMDLVPDSGNSSIQAVQRTTDSEGTAIFRVSNEVPEQVLYQVRGMGITLNEEITIDFLGIDADLSSITVSNDRIQANGSEQAEITISARDEDNRPFTNLNMDLIPDRGSSVIQTVQSITDDDGNAIFRVSSELPEQIRYSARGLGITLSDTVIVNFVPVAPVALSATNVETRTFTANWELVQGADSYRLDVSQDSTFTDFISGYEDRNVGLQTSFIIDNALPGRTYFYRVRAAIEDLIGANSDTINLTTFPDTPVATTASNLNALNFTANWQPAEGAQSYMLDVALDPDFVNMVPGYDDLDTGLQTEKTIQGLEMGTDYYYRVRSVAGPRTSPNSNNISTTTLTISAENSNIEKEQLRILANGNQNNQIVVTVKSEEGIALSGLNVTLIPESGQSEINAKEPLTNEKGEAQFLLTNTQAETVSYQVQAHQTIIGSFSVEFLPDSGELALGFNYPNPFQTSTTIPVTVPRNMNITITVYDQLGRPVQTVVDGSYEPGYYEIPFRPHGLASGIYFYRLVTDEKMLVNRMVFVR